MNAWRWHIEWLWNRLKWRIRCWYNGVPADPLW